jgi:hypothetical protein
LPPEKRQVGFLLAGPAKAHLPYHYLSAYTRNMPPTRSRRFGITHSFLSIEDQESVEFYLAKHLVGIARPQLRPDGCYWLASVVGHEKWFDPGISESRIRLWIESMLGQDGLEALSNNPGEQVK